MDLKYLLNLNGLNKLYWAPFLLQKIASEKFILVAVYDLKIHLNSY